MEEIVRINLDNEMDLILAHKRTMKLAELCGLSAAAQTTFATAVSEIARAAIGYGSKSHLVLNIGTPRPSKKEIIATLYDKTDLSKNNAEAFSYARRLMGDMQKNEQGGWYMVSLKHQVPFGGTISPARVEQFKTYFKSEPPLSPYDEIRKKNIQLIELSNKLQENENQYRLLTDTLPLMIFAINHKGEITYSNKWLKDFTGTSAANMPWLSVLHPDDVRSIQPEWEKSIGNRSPFHGQGRLRTKDKAVWHLISIVPVKNEKDITTHWIGFFADIELQKQIEATLKDNKELKETQRSLKRYQTQLEEKVNELNLSNRELEQFAYIASHDLQEPLRKIKTFAVMLGKKLELNQEQQPYFDKIISSADRMSTLIRDVLHYSTLNNESHQLVRTELNTVAKNVLTDFELAIKEKNATITVGQLPVIEALPLQFDQLFSNLVSNGLKFADKDRKPVIDISWHKLSEQELEEKTFLRPGIKYQELTFKDNGTGFEQQYAEKIFIIFQRLTDKTTGGNGIGLALVKKIVDNHGGHIRAESQPGVGTTFRIFLPIE